MKAIPVTLSDGEVVTVYRVHADRYLYVEGEPTPEPVPPNQAYTCHLLRRPILDAITLSPEPVMGWKVVVPAAQKMVTIGGALSEAVEMAKAILASWRQGDLQR